MPVVCHCTRAPLPPPPPFPGAGDAMDDANFEHGTANGAILRLTKALAWIGRVWRSACRIARGCGWGYTLHAGCAEETLASADGLRDEEPTSFLDRVFQNEMNVAGGVTGQRGGGGASACGCAAIRTLTCRRVGAQCTTRGLHTTASCSVRRSKPAGACAPEGGRCALLLVLTPLASSFPSCKVRPLQCTRFVPVCVRA